MRFHLDEPDIAFHRNVDQCQVYAPCQEKEGTDPESSCQGGIYTSTSYSAALETATSVSYNHHLFIEEFQGRIQVLNSLAL